MSGLSDRTFRNPLTTVRENPRYHWVGLVIACLLGLVAATAHWLGLVVGGALVGLLAADVKRAVLSGIGFGLLVILVWAGLLTLAGSLGKMMAMAEFSLFPVGIALGLAILGSLVRGVFP